MKLSNFFLSLYHNSKSAIMKQLFGNKLLTFSREEKTNSQKIFSFIFGIILFLCILPGLFILIGIYSKDYVLLTLTKIYKFIELTVSIAGMAVGLFFIIWAALSLWKIGKGTPTLDAPTQELVISGPYRLCRNPMGFGVLLYYLGIGTLIGGLVVGIMCFIFGITIGSIYHKFFEESELEERFGEEYKQYKEKTPFLFPRIKT